MNIESSPLSIVILILTVSISLLGFGQKSSLIRRLMLNPYKVVHKGKWYQILTSNFVHADFMHLIFNMMTFYFFAPKLESTIGMMYWAVIYFGSAVFSDLSTIYKNRNNPDYNSLGASGAISGILFSYILFYPDAKIGIMILPIGLPSPVFAVLYLLYCYFASKKSMDFINHEAHLWGAVAGLVLTIILIPESLGYFFNHIFGR